MIRLTYIITIVLSIIFSSCESRRNRLDRSNLIPDNDLVPILTDIYITDGLMGVPRIAMKYPPIDSLSAYTQIIEKHGYTKERLDKTLKYYFIKNPKKLIKIYDKVLGILSEMESRIQKDIAKSKLKTGSLWTGPDSYFYPDPSGNDSASFDIALQKPGFYALNASVTLFPDDQSLNSRLTAYTCHPDSIDTGKRNYVKPLYYLKDGHEHRYSLIVKVPPKSVLRLRGSLYEHDNHPDDWQKHLVIQNISVVFSAVEL
jgi:hypothetical protein